MRDSGSTFFLDLSNGILQTATYADVFDYPLSAAEIHHYLTGIRASREEVEQVLQGNRLLVRTGGWYTLPGREHNPAPARANCRPYVAAGVRVWTVNCWIAFRAYGGSHRFPGDE